MNKSETLIRISSYNYFNQRKHFIIQLTVNLFLLTSILIFLLQPTQALAERTNLYFKNYTGELEIPNSFILKILQDNQGYIWAATQTGLFRFDGQDYKKFIHTPSDSTSLPNNYVNTLLIDKLGKMWVGTDGGLSRYDEKTESFYNYSTNSQDFNSLSNNIVMSIAESRNGILWLATWGGGINSFSPITEQFTHFQNNPQDPTSLPDDLVYTLIEDNNGVIWVGTRSGGLSQLDKVTGTFKNYQHDFKQPNTLSNNSVYTILEDSNETLWVGTRGGGLNKFNRTPETFEHFRYDKEKPNSLGSDEVFSIFEDDNANLWIGTLEGGLSLFDRTNNHFERYVHDSDKNSISNNNVWSITQSRDGNIWLGTFGGGLSQFEPNAKLFGRVAHDGDIPYGLPSGYLSAFYVDKSGTTWVGMQSGLYRLDKNTKKFFQYLHDPEQPTSLSSSHIRTILEDSQGRLWIGTTNGLNLLNKQDNSFTRFIHEADNINSLSDNSVVIIHEDSFGLIWVGTQNGLNRMNENSTTFTRFHHSQEDINSIRNNSINTLYTSIDGLLWVGTSGGGLSQFDFKSQDFTHYFHSANKVNSLSSDVVYSIAQDSKGVLWIATETGLNKFNADTKSFVHYQEQDGLQENRLLAVIVDGNDKLWLSNLGISSFDPVTEKFSNFIGANVGCFGSSQGAHHQTKDGQLFFGIESYCAFYPEDIVIEQKAPTVIFTDFLLLNKSVNIEEQGKLTKTINHTKSITLSHRDNIFSIEFSALDFFDSSKTLFQYHLEGFNETWIETDSKNRRATYTNLPAGKYTFRVKARSAQGVWNNKGKSFDIFIEPAPWKTWWAYSIYILIILLILGAFIRLQQQKFKLERLNNIKLERTVLARTKELNAKNKSLNQALRRLEEITLTDQLTNAHNRRFLEKFIVSEIAQLNREHFDHKHTKLGFIIIDADHFKSVNDTYGHDAGDIVLIKLVEIITNSCRASDWIIRWGGEEFVVVSRFKKETELHHLAERIRKNIENFEFDLEKGRQIKMTCSMGLASYPFIRNKIDAYTWQQTMSLADIALYEAKNSGRNTWVSLYEKDITEPETFYQQSSIDLRSQVDQGVIYYQKAMGNSAI